MRGRWLSTLGPLSVRRGQAPPRWGYACRAAVSTFEAEHVLAELRIVEIGRKSKVKDIDPERAANQCRLRKIHTGRYFCRRVILPDVQPCLATTTRSPREGVSAASANRVLLSGMESSMLHLGRPRHLWLVHGRVTQQWALQIASSGGRVVRDHGHL